MPKAAALRAARRDAHQGKKASTQAGEFVRAEMKELERGNPRVRSRKQAIAIGLSEARQAGIAVRARAKASKPRTATRKRKILGPR